MELFVLSIVAFVALAIAGQVQVARKKSEEAARISEENRIAKMAQDNPDGYRAVLERRIAAEAAAKEAAERQRKLLEELGKAGGYGLAMLEKALKNRR